MKKTHYGDEPAIEDPIIPDESKIDPLVIDAPGQKEVVLPAAKHSEIVEQILNELRADGRPSATNCIYHLQASIELLHYHEDQPPLDPPAGDPLTARKGEQPPKEEPTPEPKY